MEGNNLRSTADQLVEMAGGYNLRTLIAVALAGLAIGFLLGGLLGRQFGFWFLLLPVVICLAAAGVIVIMRFQQSGGLENLRGGGRVGQGGSFSSMPPSAFTPPPGAPPVELTELEPPGAPPVELTELEQQIMERVNQGAGSLSVSALANELSVPEETVRKTIEDLANRGAIRFD